MIYSLFFNFKEFLFNFYFFRNKILYKLKRYSKLNAFNKINLTNKSIFIDMGGNNGVVSQYIYDKYKCFIYIYEPHRKCFEILKKKFFNNKKIKIFNCAVSNSSGYKKFYFHSYAKSNDYYNLSLSESSSLEKNKKNISINKFELVKCLDIKNILKNFNYIDIIKIDIEGHEYKILPIIFKNIKNIEKIFIEFHGRDGPVNLKKNYNYWTKKINNSHYKNKFMDW